MTRGSKVPGLVTGIQNASSVTVDKIFPVRPWMRTRLLCTLMTWFGPTAPPTSGGMNRWSSSWAWKLVVIVGTRAAAAACKLADFFGLDLIAGLELPDGAAGLT